MRIRTLGNILLGISFLMAFELPSVSASPFANSLCTEQQSSTIPNDELWSAARQGDLAKVKSLLDQGIDVNAATAYGSTALCFAADRGHVEVVKLLLDRGANPNPRDTFYKMSALDWAQANGHFPVITAIYAAGGSGADDALLQAVGSKNIRLLEALLAANCVKPETLALAKRLATLIGHERTLETLNPVSAPELELPNATAEQLQRFTGTFATETGTIKLTAAVSENLLTIDLGSGTPAKTLQIADSEFLANANRIVFETDGDEIKSIQLTLGGQNHTLRRRDFSEFATPAPAVTETPPTVEEKTELPPFQPSPLDAAISSVNWPSFRGTGARGVADGQNPPIQWDVESNTNVLWKTAVPGLGNSCPTIWGDRLFVTSAVSDQANREVKIGNYGSVDSVEDDSVYDFIIYCLNKHSGEIIWQQKAHTAKPAVKRHSKSSHANPTVATDGKHLIAFFGSEGLFCYDLDGQLLWKKELGFLDSGWFLDAGYQWGFGSSPIIYRDRVIVQCDIQKGSFIAAYSLANGNELWRTDRDEIPTWPSPTVHEFGDLPMVITHGTRAARGYDARDGQQLWSLGSHSEIVVPTPFVAHDLIFIASGYAPIQPIVALRPNARGDLKLADDEQTTTVDGDSKEVEPSAKPEAIAWNTMRGGPYMPTPIAYGDYLYVCSNQGVLTCYRATTGEQIYRERIKVGGTAAFTASPLAADGHLYFTAEDGRTAVVRAGEKFHLAGINACNNKVLSTPAISENTFYLRTIDEIFAFRSQAAVKKDNE